MVKQPKPDVFKIEMHYSNIIPRGGCDYNGVPFAKARENLASFGETLDALLVNCPHDPELLKVWHKNCDNVVNYSRVIAGAEDISMGLDVLSSFLRYFTSEEGTKHIPHKIYCDVPSKYDSLAKPVVDKMVETFKGSCTLFFQVS